MVEGVELMATKNAAGIIRFKQCGSKQREIYIYFSFFSKSYNLFEYLEPNVVKS